MNDAGTHALRHLMLGSNGDKSGKRQGRAATAATKATRG
jgi:hypothetical protein